MQKNTVKETCIVNSIVLFILIVSFSITLFITDKLGYYIMMSVSFILLLTHSKKAFLSVSVKYLFLLSLLHLLGKLPYELGVASFIGLLLIGIKLFPIFVLGRILISLSPLVLLICSFSLPVLGNQLLLLSDAVDWFQSPTARRFL